MLSLVVIIGVGNLLHGDDGIGIAVARGLQGQVSSEVAIHEEPGDGLRLLETWRGASSIVLIDAMRSGALPGTTRRFDVRQERLPFPHFASSTHAFGVPQAIELARALDQLPPRFVVFGIEGESFELGSALSYRARRAVDEVVTTIQAEVDRIVGQPVG
jgi:hydrogenase maturation protease